MWLSRRQALISGACAVALGLGACSFTPVYAPGGAASKLQGRIAIPEPNTREQYLVTRQLETRLGRADPAPLTLAFTVSQSIAELGTTATGGTTRYHRTGTLTYALKTTDTAATIDSGSLTRFTGYSATGNTAATLAAERDSLERLMIILADQLIDRLQFIDPALLP